MGTLSLIFVAAVASVVSAAPQLQSFPGQQGDSVQHVVIPWPAMPDCDYEIHDEGESNGNYNGNENSKICKPSEAQKNVAGMEDWCNANCFHNPPYCPESYCQCYDNIDPRSL